MSCKPHMGCAAPRCNHMSSTAVHLAVRAVRTQDGCKVGLPLLCSHMRNATGTGAVTKSCISQMPCKMID